MHTRFLSLIAILFLAAFPRAVHAEARVSNPRVTYTFGQEVIFEATLAADQPVKEVVILFESQGETHTQPGTAEVGEDGEIRYIYQVKDRPLRAFSEVQYRFHITLEDGEQITSQTFSFFYEDNRVQWQVLEEDPFRVHWYSGDIAFAQRVLDTAQAGLQRIQGLLAVPDLEMVDIYVYDDPYVRADLLPSSVENPVDGHAFVDLNLAVVSIPEGPEEQIEMERSVPHELMHLVLYNLAGPAYAEIPVWLNEGLATYASLYPDPNYQVLLNEAYKEDKLYLMSSMCTSFPRYISNVQQAYAQSASFTRYLHQTYGVSKLNSLIQHYADGMSCERGVEVVTGKSLLQLDRAWRSAEFAENTGLVILVNLLPWLALMAVALGAPMLLIVSGWRGPKQPASTDQAR